MPGPVEQAETDLLLQSADLLGQRRRGDEQLGGGPPEMTLVGDGDEVAQQPEVEVHPFSSGMGALGWTSPRQASGPVEGQ